MVPRGLTCRRGRMEKAPVYETGECRFDPCRRRATRRSSVDESTALRRRGPHVRTTKQEPGRLPRGSGGLFGRQCRRGGCQRSGPCSSASQSASPVRTRSWVRLPPRAPSWKGTGQMRSPPATRVRVASPCGCESRPFRSRKRSGQIRGLSRKQVGVARPLWVRVPPLPPRRDSPTDTTPGPQPGGRGSTPRRGARCQIV